MRSAMDTCRHSESFTSVTLPKACRKTRLGYVELLQEVLSLSEGTLVDLLGPFPTQGDFLSLSFEDIKPVLQFIATQDSPSDSGVSPVPQHKIEYNRLGEDERMSLLNGMRKARLVRAAGQGTSCKIGSLLSEKVRPIKSRRP
jgi:hypothetical protein